MTALIIDPQALPELVKQRQEAFDLMRYQLQLDDDLQDSVLDAYITALALPIIQAIDCKTCGNCCRSLAVFLEEDDAKRLSQGAFIPLETITAHFLDTENATQFGEWGMFKQLPCPFLSGTLCTVYAHRPNACREYPSFTPEFRWLLDDLMDGAHICPIIYNVLVATLPHVDNWIRNTAQP